MDNLKESEQWKPQPFENVWFPVEDPTKNDGAIPAYGNIKAVLDNGKLNVRVIEAESSLNGRIPYKGYAVIDAAQCASRKRDIYDKIKKAHVENKPLYPVQVEGYDLNAERSKYLDEQQETVNGIDEEEQMTYRDLQKMIGESFSYRFDEAAKLTLTGYYDGKEIELDFDKMDERTYEDLNAGDTDTEYKEAMRILHGPKTYEFDHSELIVGDYYSCDEVKLNFDFMTEKIFEKLHCTEDLDDDFSRAIDSIGTENNMQM